MNNDWQFVQTRRKLLISHISFMQNSCVAFISFTNNVLNVVCFLLLKWFRLSAADILYLIINKDCTVVYINCCCTCFHLNAFPNTSVELTTRITLSSRKFFKILMLTGQFGFIMISLSFRTSILLHRI